MVIDRRGWKSPSGPRPYHLGALRPPLIRGGGRSRPRVCAYKHIHVPPPAEHELAPSQSKTPRPASKQSLIAAAVPSIALQLSPLSPAVVRQQYVRAMRGREGAATGRAGMLAARGDPFVPSRKSRMVCRRGSVVPSACCSCAVAHPISPHPLTTATASSAVNSRLRRCVEPRFMVSPPPTR
jgi:hypothetical protein